MNHLEYWLSICEYCKFTLVEIQELLDKIGSLEKIWNADEGVLIEISKSNKLAGQIPEARKRTIPDGKNLILDLAKKESVHVMPMISPEYPDRLRLIKNPPKTLFIRGNPQTLQKNAIAIVGTRNPTEYARSKAKKLAYDLAKEDFTIISGLAEGIDTESHLGALESGGMTVAVLPSGVLRAVPPKNIPLAERIVSKGGLLVSEYGLETPPIRYRFIERNRIISGLAMATIVAEGSLKSGTRHTVDFARSQSRCILALNPIDDSPQTELPRNLHSKGVDYVTNSIEVLKAVAKWNQRVEYQQLKLE